MDELFQKLERWHEDDQFSEIIRAVEAIPPEERDYPLTLQLARAYSNLAVLGDGQVNRDSEEVDQPLLEKCIALLESIREEGREDPRWFARMTYALWMCGGREAEALPCARRWAALAPEDPDAAGMVEEISDFLAGSASPEIYTQEQMEAVETFIGENFGPFEQVFHEIYSPDIHVDICLIPPGEERNYYTLVTMGMGAHRMDVPEELAEYRLERAELVIALPPDWRFDQESLQDKGWFWPIYLLKSTARLPVNARTWLGWGHTVALREVESYADGVRFRGALLIEPQRVEANCCSLPPAEEGAEAGEVNFYQLLPLYREEIDYKLAQGAEALLDRMGPVSFVVDTRRPNRLAKKKPLRREGNRRSSYDE